MHKLLALPLCLLVVFALYHEFITHGVAEKQISPLGKSAPQPLDAPWNLGVGVWNSDPLGITAHYFDPLGIRAHYPDSLNHSRSLGIRSSGSEPLLLSNTLKPLRTHSELEHPPFFRVIYLYLYIGDI